jgi:hypothetical protein
LNNWDHHGEPPAVQLAPFLEKYFIKEMGAEEVRKLKRDLREDLKRSATWQVFHSGAVFFGGKYSIEEVYRDRKLVPREKSLLYLLIRLVCYIDKLDIEGPEALGPKSEELFPTLSDVFSGMLLTERNPVEQFHKGVEILKTVIDSKQDPFGRIEGFDSYAKAKAENNRQIAKAVEQAQWTTTQSGLKLGYLETEFFGAPGALYGAGAQVVVALNPNYNGVRKFTIAGNGIRVDSVKDRLNAKEPGWGGPPSGTILGSPREGSNLSLEEVVRIVKEAL